MWGKKDISGASEVGNQIDMQKRIHWLILRVKGMEEQIES